jgi:hypothetical protein
VVTVNGDLTNNTGRRDPLPLALLLGVGVGEADPTGPIRLGWTRRSIRVGVEGMARKPPTLLVADARGISGAVLELSAAVVTSIVGVDTASARAAREPPRLLAAGVPRAIAVAARSCGKTTNIGISTTYNWGLF